MEIREKHKLSAYSSTSCQNYTCTEFKNSTSATRFIWSQEAGALSHFPFQRAAFLVIFRSLPSYLQQYFYISALGPHYGTRRVSFLSSFCPIKPMYFSHLLVLAKLIFNAYNMRTIFVVQVWLLLFS